VLGAKPQTGRLRGVAFTLGRTGSPILADCLAFVECRIAGWFDGGDHSIVLGEVVHESLVNDVPPLLFFRGRYRKLASDV